ncbi:bifunctional glutamate N-acetyltransferase/amino-acid acetyltransferase ArgJ [Amphibacillus sp. MSJ-3]|uniref:bifunctional glutamate N-acetyltransferase/amino-acid acetyltransferase ArgJ n=1 Tax=Amphibacillus sp. MSJ-3 TaxID=2841505 RepID=UPI00273958FD|nr:bifunctional glutamate N-acetyltransferase/amino-acid acetyltransferase ArgJ [Amphibacillus sp. MSJ-3]
MGMATTKQEIKKLDHGGVSSPKGFRAGGRHCGIRKEKPDLGWLISDTPADAFAVYTTNKFQAAPLKVTQESLAIEHKLQALIVNSGIANACTGEQGLQDAYRMRAEMADKFKLAKHHVAVASTGLIGDFLPMEKLTTGISAINPEDNLGHSFETAILTTDTREKKIAVQIEIDDQKVTIGGAAKGSGMINPNMATMLGFITTDANVEPGALEQQLKHLTNQTFNMITVDGDTSTNDMVLVMANGQASNQPLEPNHPQWELFAKALAFIFQYLAKEIARDGEGATKLIEVQVEGTNTEIEARKIAKAIMGSNLVKTAIHGADANWGRIITAIGYSGVDIIPSQVSVKIGDIPVVKNGLPVLFDEEKMKLKLAETEIGIFVKVGESNTKALGWGCDLSYEYVRINALYRT